MEDMIRIRERTNDDQAKTNILDGVEIPVHNI
jgi:hypothetical protein